MDGFEAVAQIKKIPHCHDIPVIFITAVYSDDPYVKRGYEVGVGRRLSSTLERLPVGILIADTEGRICQTTEEVSRIFRSGEPTAHDAYGEILDWWNSSGQMIKNGPLARALQGEALHSEPIEIRCFDGSIKTILSSAAPLRGLDGRIVGAVVLVQDLTETRRIEEDLEQRVTRLVSLGVELEQSAPR